MKKIPSLLSKKVVLPKTISHIEVKSPYGVKLIKSLESSAASKNILLFYSFEDNLKINSSNLLKFKKTIEESPNKIYKYGTYCRILGFKRFKNYYLLSVEGLEASRIGNIYYSDFLYMEKESHQDTTEYSLSEFSKMATSLRQVVSKLHSVNNLNILPQDSNPLIEIENSGLINLELAEQIIHSQSLKFLDFNSAILILSEANLEKKLEVFSKISYNKISEIKAKNEVQKRTQEKIQKEHEKYILKQQRLEIDKILGEGSAEIIHDYKRKLDGIKGIDKDSPLFKKIREEIKKLEYTSPNSSEYNVIRSYLDFTLSIPWNTRSESSVDIPFVEEFLNKNHSGLENPKQKILELMAIKKLKKDNKGAIICLSGPPGVGKTSLAKSIAEALNLPFERISLGGVSDESVIRGHRKTYIGAMAGKFAKALVNSGVKNPVILLDEIDKVSKSNNGDPNSALLEVLDPQQNYNFHDNYVEVPLDLSEVIFICTANNLRSIPGPLRDRLEIIQLPGYSLEEKFSIAQHHIIPKSIRESGLDKKDFNISDEALSFLIKSYTMEAGVRQLEKKISDLCRKIALNKVKGNIIDELSINIIIDLLGNKYLSQKKLRDKLDPGVVTGLAYTSYGGDVLYIETSWSPGNQNLTLTGQLGNVMKESAKIALSYLKSNPELIKKDSKATPKFLIETSDLHIHFPAGATPKDGPSAGIALVTSLISLFMDKEIPNDIAMTGEISLKGRVLPVGGIKEKLLAAYRSGVKNIIIPKDNEKDLDDIPEDLRKQLNINLVSDYKEVYSILFKDK